MRRRPTPPLAAAVPRGRGSWWNSGGGLGAVQNRGERDQVTGGTWRPGHSGAAASAWWAGFRCSSSPLWSSGPTTRTWWSCACVSTGGAGGGPGGGRQAEAAAPRASRGVRPAFPRRWAPWPRVLAPVGALSVGSGPRFPAGELPVRGFRPAARCSWGPEFGPARRPRPRASGWLQSPWGSCPSMTECSQRLFLWNWRNRPS